MDTQVTFILDSSGSMRNIKSDTVGGFNEFLSDQQAEDGTAAVSLIEFDTTVTTKYEGQPMESAPELSEETYTPGGQTSLHDAIVTGIDQTEQHIEQLAARTQPETVIVVVLTDGKENASETPSETVRERVEQAQDRGWEFLFIGANQDAALTAETMGMEANKSLDMDHSGEGTNHAYKSTSRQVSSARQTGSVDGYDETDRQRQDDAS